MNEIIKELYNIEERAGQIVETMQSKKQELERRKQEKEEQIEKELQGEMEGRLTILKTQLDAKAEEEINRIAEDTSLYMEQLNQKYEKESTQIVQAILGRITEV